MLFFRAVASAWADIPLKLIPVFNRAIEPVFDVDQVEPSSILYSALYFADTSPAFMNVEGDTDVT